MGGGEDFETEVEIMIKVNKYIKKYYLYKIMIKKNISMLIYNLVEIEIL